MKQHEEGRHFWWSSSPTSAPEKISQDQDLSCFECFQGWSLHKVSSQVPVFNHPHGKKTLFFSLCLNRIFCTLINAHCLLSCNWIPLRKAWLSLLYSPQLNLEPSLLQAGQSQALNPSLCLRHFSHLHGPSLHVLQVCPWLPGSDRTRTGPSTADTSPQGWAEGKVPSVPLCQCSFSCTQGTAGPCHQGTMMAHISLSPGPCVLFHRQCK